MLFGRFDQRTKVQDIRFQINSIFSECRNKPTALMQGKRSSFSAFPETLTFDHSSSSSDSSIDLQMSRNNIHTSSQNLLPDCIMTSSETNVSFLHHNPRQNSEWNTGETSYRAGSQNQENERRTTENPWTSRFEPSNILSFDNLNANSSSNPTTNGSFHLQNSSSGILPRDLNMNPNFIDVEDDDCQVIEHPNTFLPSVARTNEKTPAVGSSSGSFPDGSGCSLDGRRLSSKRKALEVNTGQSSGSGSPNPFQQVERTPWHTAPALQNHITTILPPMQEESDTATDNVSEQANSRQRLGLGGAISERTRRNFRLRFNATHQQEDPPFLTETGNSRTLHNNSSIDLNPVPPIENGSLLHGQSVLLHVPPARRNNHQSRWSGVSSSRTNPSSSAAISGAPFYEESMPRNIPRNISEHPMFVPSGERRNSPTNWNLASGNNTVPGGHMASSHVGSSSGVNASSAPNFSHRSFPPFPRRLSEIVRRSLLSSAGVVEPGGQSGNSAPLQEIPISSESGSRGHQSGNAYGIPYSMRALAAASAGRSNVMSEQIRHVLDLMRRGEGLRFEDVMMLDHSVFFGMADIHDRHRDMRLDVDNMSYEELLALEERIGNVCTGLSEENIIARLKQHKYMANPVENQADMEPCSICREEYSDGEDLGKLECGHDFHKECIKQWLIQKNLCPICKTTGLNT